jgi:hypothetical protein
MVRSAQPVRAKRGPMVNSGASRTMGRPILRDASLRDAPQDEGGTGQEPGAEIKKIFLGLLTSFPRSAYIPSHPTHRGASSGDRPKAGREAAPAGGACNPTPGRPRPAVRPHYEGLPSMAGRGGRRRAAGAARAGRPQAFRSPARKHGLRGQKSPRVERREAPLRFASGEDMLRKRVGRLASRSGGFANLRVSRRSAPLIGSDG